MMKARGLLLLSVTTSTLIILNFFSISKFHVHSMSAFPLNLLFSREARNVGASFINWRNLSQDEIESLSVLGRRLYLSEDLGEAKSRNFTIHVWKSFFQTTPRFLKQYGDKIQDPFRKCSVKNCKFSYFDSDVYDADAVVFHLHKIGDPSTFPTKRNPQQRWIWLTDEAPYPIQTFRGTNDTNYSHYNGYFNWSMTYRMDSDIPVPSGRAMLISYSESLKYKEVDYFKRKSKLAAAMGSDCKQRNNRWDYVRELQKHIPVDFYGKCGNLTCPGRMTKDCELLFDYKFYLAFENANCMEYITEKPWWNAIEHGAVPIVMGAKIEDYRKILPPGSFIHVAEFSSPRDLAEHLRSVGQNRTKYMEYHSWRSQFTISNEHGYSGADNYHYCRICEALNYNDEAPKVYHHLDKFWNPDTQCYPPTWHKKSSKKKS